MKRSEFGVNDLRCLIVDITLRDLGKLPFYVIEQAGREVEFKIRINFSNFSLVRETGLLS